MASSRDRVETGGKEISRRGRKRLVMSGEGWRGLERGLYQLFLQLCVNSRTPKSLIIEAVLPLYFL